MNNLGDIHGYPQRTVIVRPELSVGHGGRRRAMDRAGVRTSREVMCPKCEAELDGHAVPGPIRGTGTFDVWKNGEGLLKIRIVTYNRESTQYTKHELRIYVPQEGVKLIKRQPSGSPCGFSVFDPQFQRYVRGSA